jgi:predicted glutamine amidotransferase
MCPMRKIIVIAPIFIILIAAYGNIDFRADRPAGQPSPDISDAKSHNCRLWAAISEALPESVVYNDLLAYPNSLKNLSVIGNIDGWGVGWYRTFGALPGVFRSPLRAYSDSTYDSLIEVIDISSCRIILAHIRDCSVGCCCPGCYTIDDPHPFHRLKNGKYWSFIHNGTIAKSSLRELIGEAYLDSNPPNGSGIPECDPADTSLVTDSELFFILLLKHIEYDGWDVMAGLHDALVELIYSDPGSELNLVLSDGYDLWAFRRFNTLYYLVDTLLNYSAIASEYPSFGQGNWLTMIDYQLLYLPIGQTPEIVSLRPDLPPLVHCPNDTALLYVFMRPVCLKGFEIDDPDGNVDTVVTNVGVFDGKRLCFDPHDGPNTISMTAVDTYGGTGACSLVVFATLSNPGFLGGSVTDSLNAPFPTVEIEILVAEIFDTSGMGGEFLIDYLVPGIYDIKFSHDGYLDTIAQAVEIAANETTLLSIAMRAGCNYIPGDANGSGVFNGIDVTYSVSYLKGMSPPPVDICPCPYHGLLYAAADANGDCLFNGLDVVYSVNYLKTGRRRPIGCPDCPPID